MIFTHAFAGVATTYITKKILRYRFPQFQENLLWFIGIIAAIFPDFDLLLVIFNPQLHHRYLITHSIFTYVFLSILFYFFGFLLYQIGWIRKHFTLKFFEIASIVFFLGTASHIFLDFISGGVVLFAPFTYVLYGIVLPVSTEKSFWVLDYIRSYYFFPEIALFISYVYLRNKIANIVVDYLPVVLFFVSIASILFFSK